MPKQHKSGEFKQKNKPFKGSSKRNVKERLGKVILLKQSLDRQKTNTKDTSQTNDPREAARAKNLEGGLYPSH